MPVVRGDKTTLNLILYYSIITVAVSLIPLFIRFNWIYLGFSVTLGSIFIIKSIQARAGKNHKYYWGLFKFSIIYLFGMLAGIALAARL